MKCGATLMGILGALLLDSGAGANVPEAPAYPYQGIMDRNIFGLKPPPAPPRPEDIKPPIPDINLTGITTILGNKRVLLKLPAKPPQRPKEEFYILTEGQSEADIEVLNIDELAGTVKINNHGTVQTLDFVNNGIKTASGAAGPNAPPVPGSAIQPPPSLGMRQIPPRPLRTATGPGAEQASANPGVPSYPGSGNTSAQSEIAMSLTPKGPGFTQAPDIGMSGEEQELLIEAQRQKMLEEGDAEQANMLPITDYTPPDGQPLLPQ